VVPFYSKPNETAREKTKVVIPAEVDGRHGIFILDLGATETVLNRTFLQPRSVGGVDTVTDANRIPDHTPMTDYFHGDLQPFDKAHVTMRIGTLVSNSDSPCLTHTLQEPDPHRYNAVLGHLWGNFSWVFAPRLGNIGLAELEPFETIIDYTHRQVVLIQLDQIGHRLVEVPAYTPKWTAPLVPVPLPRDVKGCDWLGLAIQPGSTLDTLNTANNTQVRALDTGAPESGDDLLGYDFLSHLGVFGVNQRTHQLILYR
jgi:hypothetical protein